MAKKYTELFTIPGDIRRRITAIALPSFIELFLGSLFGMVDMVMLGRASDVYIAASGLTNQPTMLLIATFAAVNVGATTTIAWNIGAKNNTEASAIAAQVVSVNLVVSLVVSAIGFLMSAPIVRFMGGNADTFNLAVEYFRIIILGLPFMAINMGITASLRGAGETKIPMYYNLFSNLLNVAGNYVLIYGFAGIPALGVAGAAWSTTGSRVLGCLISLFVITFTNKSKLRIQLRHIWQFHWGRISTMLRIGIPSAVEQLIMQSGFMLYARTVSSLGTEVYSAHLIGLNICGLTFSPSQCFSITSTALTGQFVGAKDFDSVNLYVRKIRLMANYVSGFIGIGFILFAYPIAAVYTPNPNIAAMTAVCLRIVAFAQPSQSTQLVMAGSLRGAGDTLYPLLASLSGIWIFRVLMSILFVNVFHWGLVGAWIALLLDQTLRAVIVTLRFNTGKWREAARRKSERAVASASTKP